MRSHHRNIISLYLYSRCLIVLKQDEGLTKIKIRLVNENKADFVKFLKLQDFLIISKHIEENCEGKENTNLLEDIFEAFIGALFLDTNSYKIVTDFLINIIERHIDFSDLIINDNNYKDQLLRYFQKNFNTQPKYETIKNEIHLFQIYILLLIDKTLIVSGKGSTKKKQNKMLPKTV